MLYISNPPVNVLSKDVRIKILAAFRRAQDDDGARAIVITADGRSFPSGPDVPEFETGPQEPTLAALCDEIEASPKPVVAALHGSILGGGFELALACHGRVAKTGTRVGFPEIALGMLPIAGATQRLPRVVNVYLALDMLLLKGVQVELSEGKEMGLVDELVYRRPPKAAHKMARQMVESGFQRTRDRRDQFTDPFQYQDAIATARETYGPTPTAAQTAVIDLIESAPLLKFDQGLSLERELFGDLRVTPEAKALRHVFLATRRAAQFPRGITAPKPARRIAILGANAMSAPLCVTCLNVGAKVTLFANTGGDADRVVRDVRETYKRSVNREQLSASARDARLQNFVLSNDLDDLSNCDLVIEMRDRARVGQDSVLGPVSSVIREDAVMAVVSDNEALDVIAAQTEHPDRCMKLGLFQPMHQKRAIEIGTLPETQDWVRAAMLSFAKGLRKSPLPISLGGGVRGTAGARMFDALCIAAERIVARGVSPYRVDEVIHASGYYQGPFAMLDYMGLDRAWQRRVLTGQEGESPFLNALVSAGRHGLMTKTGFYLYPKGLRRLEQDPEVLTLIDAARGEGGPAPDELSDDEIVELTDLALLNEGARLVDEGILARASDADVIMLLGHGYPRKKGGPMKAAELTGLLSRLRRLEELSAQDSFWEPAQSLKSAVLNGNQFDP